MRLFLDVDGVLLGRTSPQASTYELANHATAFLRFVLTEFEVLWATTQCRHGDSSHVVSYIADHTPTDRREEVTELVRGIRATAFNVCKTEMFPTDSTSEWLWIDDSPLACELDHLRSWGQLSRLLEVNTMRSPDDLLRAMVVLRGLQLGRSPAQE